MLLKDRKNGLWIVFVSVLALAACAWYASECSRAGRLLGGSSKPGLWLGIAGGSICLFEMLLWPRKWLRRWGQTLPLGWTQTWMRAHIWLGLLSLPLLVMHGGVFPWGGALSTWLMILFLVVVASGVWGLIMQQILPARMLDDLPHETIYTQIGYHRAQLRGEAARLVLATCGRDEGGGVGVLQAVFFRVPGKTRTNPVASTIVPVPDTQALLEFFQTEVAPYLCPDSLYEYYQKDESARPARPPKGKVRPRSPLSKAQSAAMMFEDVKVRIDPRAQGATDALADLCDRCRQFERQARLHVWLHNWMVIHLPLSVALITLMVVHAVVTLKYL